MRDGGEAVSDALLRRLAADPARVLHEATAVETSRPPRSLAPQSVAPPDIAASRRAESERSETSSASDAFRKMPETAFHGLPGKVVRLVGPYSEGDPAAVLTTFLTMFG